VFTLTAVYTANPLQGSEATKYKWVLPAGVSVSGTLGTDYIESATTAGITTVYSLNKTININLKDVTPGVTAIAINAYAVNGAGTSTAKVLSLTRVLPTVVSAVTGSLNVCNRVEGFSYTITANATATKYLITGPAGSKVTSVSSPSNATNVLTTSDLTFKVVYGASGTSLTVQSVNGAGNGATKTLTLKFVACVTPPAPAPIVFNVVNNSSVAYIINGTDNNPTLTLTRGLTYTFNISASGHPFFIKTTSSTGTGNAYNVGVTNNGINIGTITFVVDANAPSQLFYNCQYHGSQAGLINIVNPTGTRSAKVSTDLKVIAYPNPSTEGFTIKSSNGKSFGVQVYDMLGRSVEQRQLKSDSQIGSNYAKGIYNVIVTQDAQVKTLRVIKQ
jgi:hypothetical protein